MLVDTNVLVYAHDAGDDARRVAAIEVLDGVRASGTGCLSVQCLSEFFWATTRGAQPILTVANASRQVERLFASWRVLDLTPMIVLEGIRGVRAHRLSFWDAQLWACARLNQIGVVLSEDFDDGRRLEGVRFVNPFAPRFELSALLSRE